MKNILRTAKFLPTWDFNQKYFPGMYCGLEVQKPTQALQSVHAREILLIEIPSGQELCRP
jgi:hypothetical protein